MPQHIGENTWLAPTKFRSAADAVTDVLRSLAGRARYLYELISGEVPSTTSDGPCTPRNPDGEIGINLSGPPWGPALLHPVAWIHGIKTIAAASAVGFRSITTRVNDDGTLSEGVVPGDRHSVRQWPIHSRRFATIPNAPYSKLAIAVRGYSSAASQCDFKVRVRVDGGAWAEDTSSYANTTTATVVFAIADLAVRMQPEGLNIVDVDIINTDSTQTLHVVAIGILQVVKLHH